MKIIIKGEMTLAQLQQCIYEQFHSLEENYAVRHSRDVTLYITFTNGTGNVVTCRDGRGEEVTSVNSNGPYSSAADHYDA